MSYTSEAGVLTSAPTTETPTGDYPGAASIHIALPKLSDKGDPFYLLTIDLVVEPCLIEKFHFNTA